MCFNRLNSKSLKYFTICSYMWASGSIFFVITNDKYTSSVKRKKWISSMYTRIDHTNMVFHSYPMIFQICIFDNTYNCHDDIMAMLVLHYNVTAWIFGAKQYWLSVCKATTPGVNNRVRHNGERVPAAVLVPVSIWFIVLMLGVRLWLRKWISLINCQLLDCDYADESYEFTASRWYPVGPPVDYNWCSILVSGIDVN